MPPTAVEDPADDDAGQAALSVPDTGDTGESGKLKTIVQLVKKCLGVKDIATMRLSLPASLLEPIPNLEYWHYLDRPDLFAAINDSDDPFERMLAVLRFTFSKDLKFIRGKVCKPYNSVLGEHFRAHWDVVPVSYPSDPTQPPIQHLFLAPAAAESTYSLQPPRLAVSDSASVRSARSGKSARSYVSSTPGKSTPATSQEQLQPELDARLSDLSLADPTAGGDSDSDELVEADEAPAAAAHQRRVRIAFLTEQVSHHPPVSAYTAVCPSRHLALTGVDQISAKVSGTTVRVMPGAFNKGLFVRIDGGPGAGETYQVTHPVAAVNGILRGSFYITVGESTVVTCSASGGGAGAGGEQLRAIIDYREQNWLGKSHFLCDGVIHSYRAGETEHLDWTRAKHVPRSRVLATFDGSWKHLIRWRRADQPEAASATLIDLSTLHVVPKAVRPLARQLPNESRRLWEDVTGRLLAKEYGEATRHKLAIEQQQRDEALERKRKGTTFIPQYFHPDIDSGIPTLTEAGRAALEEELAEEAPHPLEDLGTRARP